MKQLTTSEKKHLIQMHGEAIARSFTNVSGTFKEDIIEQAERVIEIAKSIPKIEYSIG